MATNYALMYGDTQLGLLTEYEIDQPWIRCHFVAQPAFEKIRPLFEAEIHALETEHPDDNTWEETYEAIAALNLCLACDDGKKIGPMLLHIHNKEAWFRY